jgi:hypothetical protein
MDHKILRDPQGNLQHLIDDDIRAIVPAASADHYMEHQRRAHGRDFHVQDVEKLHEVRLSTEAERARMQEELTKQADQISQLVAELARLKRSASPLTVG